ncbi:MAG: hypothetical protein ACK5RG_18675 [Cyclobacteriaceae bacterium]|nr:hypothetical protein [Flammeovirgaceae bacterium]
MKHLILKYILPLTIISFLFVTKSWVIPIYDGTETFTGFPFAYTCPAWHTSLASQIFVTELIIDLICYFGFWYLLLVGIHRYYPKFELPKAFGKTLMVVGYLLLAGTILFHCITYGDDIYFVKNPYDVEITETHLRIFGLGF